jgi:type II secretion system protein C
MMKKLNEINLHIKKKNKFLKKLNNQNILYFRNIIIIMSGVFIGTTIINTIISITLLKPQKGAPQALTFSPLQDSGESYTQIKKYVLARNIFNIAGTIPPEDLDDNTAGLIKNFDSVPCSESEGKLPFELVGILYTGNPKTNLVTFKDSRVETADVYREGQNIIEYDTYQIYKIASPSAVQLRNQNKKICLFTGSQAKSLANNSEDRPAVDNDQVFELDSEFVSEQIGPGFSKILNSARLVPEAIDGKTIGFKIYGITAGSLFEKIRLENGDVITNVNGINLEDPSQGFKIYEALQDETNITLHIKRAGVQMTKKVTVR